MPGIQKRSHSSEDFLIPLYDSVFLWHQSIPPALTKKICAELTAKENDIH
jgi:hypothetical protein